MKGINPNAFFAFVLLSKVRARVSEFERPNTYLVAHFEKSVFLNTAINIDMISTAHVNDTICSLVLYQLCVSCGDLWMV